MHRRNALALLVMLLSLCAFALQGRSVAQDDSSGRKLVNQVMPAYPPMAKNLGLKGVAKLEAQVAPNGTVKNVRIKGGHPVLAQAAVTAVLRWRWEAGPRETSELVEVRFNPE